MATTSQKNQPSISIDELSKRYGNIKNLALDNLSLAVQPGEIYGFLGPNGAGKSTTIRLLMNFIQPTKGSAKILGYDIVNESKDIKNNVGYLSGDSSMYPKMTGRQYLNYMNELQPAKSKKYIDELAKRLKADLGKKLGELSRGNRQKIGLIQAFMHQPKILILDEPSSGLDPLMQEVFYELLRESKSRGAAVFMSSHVLGEVQKVCDRVGIIREGKLVDESNISDLTAEAAQTFDITFSKSIPLAELKKIKGLRIENRDGGNVTLHMHGQLSPLFSVLSKHDVLKIDTRTLDLEELFLRFYKDKGPRK